MILLTIITFLFLILAWRKPGMGVLVAVATLPLYIIRFSIGPIPTNLFELLVAVLVLVALVKPAPTSALPAWIKSRTTMLGFLLLGVGLVIGAVVAPDRLVALGIIKGWFIVPALFAWTIWRLIDHRQWRQLVAALLLSTIPLTSLAITQFITGRFLTIDGRASAWFNSPNYLALYLVPILLLTLSILVVEHYPLRKTIGWIAWSMGLAALGLSASFGGWVALAVGILVFGLTMGAHRLSKWWATAPVLLLVIGVAAYFTNSRLHAILDLSQHSSSSVRLQVWATAWLMIREHWLAGLGPGSFAGQYYIYATRLFHPPLEASILHPHNLWLQLWISTGILGLIGFSLLVIQWWRKLSSTAPLQLRASLAAAMTALLVHGLVDTAYFKNDLAALFWLLIVITSVSNVHSTKTA